MRFDWLPKVLVVAVTGLALGLLRKYVPKPPSRLREWKYEERQIPEPLPSGVTTAFMWAIGIALLLTFFLFRAANHVWAEIIAPDMVHFYPPAVLWCFFPFFAALTIPWPLTIWLLRRNGRTDEADAIADASNEKAQMNSFVVLKWMALGIAAPIGLLTLLAIPIHLSLGANEAQVGHYASIGSEIFHYDQAKEAFLVDGISYHDRKPHRQYDLLVDFSDGRRLRANAVGDGGTNANPMAVELILKGTGLQPAHVATPEEIAPR